MFLPKIKGLKYPDEAIIRFFFKEGLHQKTGSVLELGSGNGNNLSLFFQYGWKTHGVDLSGQAVNDAIYNFEEYRKSGNLTQPFSFTNAEMTDFVDKCSMLPCEVFTIPNCLNYLDIFSAKKMLQTIAQKKMIAHNGYLFIRLRSPKDYRYGKGERLDQNTFRMTSDETNEQGLLNTFYTEHQIVKLLSEYFNIINLKVFHYDFTTYANDFYIHNSDIVLWCNVLNKV